jgi:redox-sensitive bicupin YhaK (pirin superfamily)
VKGKVAVNGETADAGELVVFDRAGNEAAIEASTDATVFVMNGQPIDEPIAGYGPFVMNTPQQIQQAVADFNAGRLGRIPELTA